MPETDETARQALIEQRLEARTHRAASATRIPNRLGGVRVPLSAAQKSVGFQHLLDPLNAPHLPARQQR
jgi:hypothetical protein